MTSRSGRGRLAGYVLTLDEEEQIGQAVRSLRRVTDDVLVVDSGSTDGTVVEAAGAGAEVCVRPFDSFDRQRNFAMDSLIERFHPDWILTIDADERLTPDLATEILERVVVNDDRRTDALVLRREVRFEGRVLRFGGVSRTRLIRLYRPDAGRYESRTVNEHFALKPGKHLGTLQFPLYHEDVKSWARHIDKHNRYSSLEAKERLKGSSEGREALPLMTALTRPDLRRRWLRETVWNHLPAKPLIRFLQMYVGAAGFLDGRPGFDIALFQAWQELCTEQKYRELVEASGTICVKQPGNHPGL